MPNLIIIDLEDGDSIKEWIDVNSGATHIKIPPQDKARLTRVFVLFQ